MVNKLTERKNQHLGWEVNLHLPVVSERDGYLNEQQSLEAWFDAGICNILVYNILPLHNFDIYY